MPNKPQKYELDLENLFAKEKLLFCGTQVVESGFQLNFVIYIQFNSRVLNNRTALVLSVLFHPLILTTYLFALLFLLSPDLVGVSPFELPALGSLLLLLFLNTFVAPALVVYYMQRMGLVSTMHMESVAERRLPFLACAVIYGIATYLFGWQLEPIGELAPQISTILASVTVSLLLVTIVSFFWKISAHATGIGGVIALLAGLLLRFNEPGLLIPFVASIVIAGLLLSARLQLNAHTPAQVLGGLLCGILVSSMTIYFFF